MRCDAGIRSEMRVAQRGDCDRERQGQETETAKDKDKDMLAITWVLSDALLAECH